MEKSCIAAMRKLGVTVIVAPYEADPQLAYLCHIGMCDAVLTEDSDIVLYSAACGTSFPILYKYNPSSGVVQSVEIDDLGITAKRVPVPVATGSSLSTFPMRTTAKPSWLSKLREHFHAPNGPRMLVQLGLLAGCDYCDNIPGVGIVTAQQVITSSQQTQQTNSHSHTHSLYTSNIIIIISTLASSRR